MRALKRAFCTTLLVGLAGCSSDEDDGRRGDGGPAGPTGTVRLAFSVTNTVRQSPTLADPLVGTVFGNLFLAREVTLTGPIEGATEYGAVEVAGVDVVTDETSSARWTSPPLPANDRYVFLGFFDLDGNGADDYKPETGDPVTLPTVNEFDVLEDQEFDLTVVFDLVLSG